MKNLILWCAGTILFVLIHMQSFSQKNYQPGYILKLNGDTVNGFVTYRNPDRNPDKIYFKPVESGEPTAFTPLEIKGFGAMNVNFESAIVKSIEHPDDINDAIPEFTFNTDTTFLQVVIRGEKSLFYFKDRKNFKNFYVANNDKYDLLLFKEYMKPVNDGKTMLTSKLTYIDQLKVYLSDCDNISGKINKTAYDYNKLLDLFNSYYQCTKQVISYKDQKEKVKFEFGIVAGVNSTDLTFEGQVYLTNSEHNKPVSFAAGLFMDIRFPKHFHNLSLYNELAYNSFDVKGTGKAVDPNNFQYVKNTRYELGASYIKMYNMLRYRFPIQKSFIFINAGITDGIAFSKKNTASTEETHFGTFFASSQGKAVDEFKTFEWGYIAGLGARVDRYSLEARMDKGNGVVSYLNVKSHTTRFSFLLGYRF